MWNSDPFLDNTAAIDEAGGIYTYHDLQSEGDKLAHTIGGRVLVFCLCTNTIGSLLGYVTFINNRIVPVMLDAGIHPDALERLVSVYEPDYLWAPDHFADYEGCERVWSVWGYSLLKTVFNCAFPLNDDLALMLSTSGSTGSPKFVRQSYKNIVANTESIVEYLKLDETERPITTLPMSYTYGLSIINSHLWVGATLILTQRTLMEKQFWAQLKDYAASSISGVPYIYEMLSKLRIFRMELPSLQTMTQAGGKLSPELHRAFAEFTEQTNRRFVVMYGQTEATARMSYLPSERSIEKCGSIGIAIPGGEFSLVDAEGMTIDQADTVGELVYKGDNVTLGYAESGADLSKGDEFGGVIATGDMAKRDNDGYYYIVGRKKRFLKVFGNRVNLDETEGLVRTAFDRECACSGKDDKMLVYVTDQTIVAKTRRFLSEKTGLNQSAFEVRVIDAIPKNEAGKTLYSALEDLRD